jgi:hypothetical protein
MEETRHALCTEHYELYMDEIKHRIVSYYRKMKDWPYFIEVAADVDWGDDWYMNDATLKYALVQILPATKEKKDL